MVQRAYVALGDSVTAGKGDSYESGQATGWARRLCTLLAERTGLAFSFTNLAANRATMADILASQLPAAQAARPDLITVAVGMNDIRGTFDPDQFARQVATVLDGATETGATVATMTLPDIVALLRLPAELHDAARQLMEQANDAIRGAARDREVLYVDAWLAPETQDPTFWSDDRLHPSARGHQIIAEAFADLLMSSSPLGCPDLVQQLLTPPEDLARREGT